MLKASKRQLSGPIVSLGYYSSRKVACAPLHVKFVIGRGVGVEKIRVILHRWDDGGARISYSFPIGLVPLDFRIL
jgi:hypothetical protein